MLAGTYTPPPDCPPVLCDLLTLCKQPELPPDTPSCPRFITTEDNHLAWKSANEHTQAGMSGITFAMYKACALDPELCAMDASSRNLAYYTGFAYKRWKSGLNAMLEKIMGNFWLRKLRTILLLEADGNMNFKKLSRDLMWVAEQAGLMVDGNYGGRKRHRAIEASLDFRLTNDLLRQKRKAAFLASTDAQGCFDRIVHSIAFLCLRRAGMHKAPITSMIETIQQMTHHVRTAFGDSDASYGFDPENPDAVPNQGLLQGNGAATTGWNAIVTLLIQMLLDAGYGLKMWSAICAEAIKMVCVNFVDDQTLAHGGPTNFTSGEAVFADAQAMLDYWEAALRATGGAVAHDKSYWYLIDFHWNGSSWQYRPKSSMPGDLYSRPVGLRPAHGHCGTSWP